MERALRAARVATYVSFVLYGTLPGTWVVRTGPDLIRQAETETTADRTRRAETAANHPRPCEMAARDH
ncbi:hypothetical protein [Streptomyces sparsogenes]|uniref:hypothetical protein n=1 Tax=Streptomyces sparsogenes TaxID=67365 RepID=UPI00114CCB9E|nr:hypothetical protein [Streptomyces sparsogenes]